MCKYFTDKLGQRVVEKESILNNAFAKKDKAFVILQKADSSKQRFQPIVCILAPTGDLPSLRKCARPYLSDFVSFTDQFGATCPSVSQHTRSSLPFEIMIAETVDQDTTAIEWTRSILLLAGLLKKHRKSVLRHLLSASYLVRLDEMFKGEARERDHIEDLRQKAEATFDLHDSVERWMRGDDAIFGFPSEKWKTLHPQMNYHLQRIRHREQHELWGAVRLPACKAKEQATIAFLNSGGDAEEMRYWPEGLEEEFLNSLIWQWKNDTGI